MNIKNKIFDLFLEKWMSIILSGIIFAGLNQVYWMGNRSVEVANTILTNQIESVISVNVAMTNHCNELVKYKREIGKQDKKYNGDMNKANAKISEALTRVSIFLNKDIEKQLDNIKNGMKYLNKETPEIDKAIKSLCTKYYQELSESMSKIMYSKMQDI